MPVSALTALVVAAAFLVGAIPWGLLLTKWIAGVDVRTVGSGNVGATNAGRVLGGKGFALVLALDASKGALPVLLLPRVAGPDAPTWLPVACGLAAVLGHVFSPFLRFKGGKGVGTSLGAIAALAPLAGVAALGAFLVALLLFRYMSLASVVAAVALAPAALALHESREFVAFAALVAAVVIVRHKANLGRIAAGTEPRVGAKKSGTHVG